MNITATIWISFGSQHGNTKNMALQLHTILAKIQGVHVNMHTINDFVSMYNKQNISEDDFVIFMISTTGDGDFPDNAIKARRFLKKYQPANYKPLVFKNYCVFGVGDNNYNNFCKPAKCLTRRLKDTPPFIKPIYYNVENDYNEFEEWINMVSKHIRTHQKSVSKWFIDRITS